ncbi:penicillin-binding transpeptidase domain-containing protein [Peribacillus frigoritolerans]|nr:penicillin-binding transpeptidase domain-containing protein [Peribacillus frigoritolerans]
MEYGSGCLSALQKSVNWYFQELDRRTGFETIQSNLQEINYGNSDVSGEFSEFWNESSLKISPVEQVQLLQAFYNNQFGYKERHIQAVKEALLLEKHEEARLSGKTGTGAVNGKKPQWLVYRVCRDEEQHLFLCYQYTK